MDYANMTSIWNFAKSFKIYLLVYRQSKELRRTYWCLPVHNKLHQLLSELLPVLPGLSITLKLLLLLLRYSSGGFLSVLLLTFALTYKDSGGRGHWAVHLK